MNSESGAKVRGNIIKVPDSSPGLLFVNGQQRQFTLEGVWKSPVAPAANMTVEVEFDGAGSLTSISVVDAQQIAKEKLNQFSGVAQEQGKVAAELARQGVGALAARMGKVLLGATVVLWIAWFFLPAVSLHSFIDSKSFTLWEFLGLDLANPLRQIISHGFFSLIGLVAIAAPIAAPFLRHPRAKFLNALPLAYLLLVPLKVRWDISEAAGKDGAEIALKLMSEVISASFGTYVLFIAALVLAVQVLKARPSTLTR